MNTDNTNIAKPVYLTEEFLTSQLIALTESRKTIRQVCLSLESEVWRNRNAQVTEKSKHTTIGWDTNKLSAAYKASKK